MTKETELLACPFCGGKAIFKSDNNRTAHWVMCGKCGCQTQKHCDSFERCCGWVAKEWNTRTQPAIPEGFVLVPKGLPEANGLFLSFKDLNEPQIESIGRLLHRTQYAHFTNVKVRINGKWEEYEADWIKHMQPVSDVGQEAEHG